MRYPEREYRRIATLRRHRPELEETLAFLERMTALARSWQPDNLHPSRPNELANGSAPLSPDRFPLDEAEAVAAMQTCLQALAETTGSNTAATALAALRDGRLDAQRLLRAYRCSDAAAFEREANNVEGVDVGLLVNVSELALKPQFVAAARTLEMEFDVSERSSRCPVCGSAPDLALVTDAPAAEGIMLAVCRLCETEWPVHRVRCLTCGNEESDTLNYLQVEDEEDARVHLCELCNHYLPVTDVRRRLEFAPAIERAALVHLELLAQSRGYRPLAGACAAAGS